MVDTYGYKGPNEDDLIILLILGISIFLAWCIGHYIIAPVLSSLGILGIIISGVLVIWIIYDLIKDLIYDIPNIFNWIKSKK